MRGEAEPVRIYFKGKEGSIWNFNVLDSKPVLNCVFVFILAIKYIIFDSRIIDQNLNVRRSGFISKLGVL